MFRLLSRSIHIPFQPQGGYGMAPAAKGDPKPMAEAIADLRTAVEAAGKTFFASLWCYNSLPTFTFLLQITIVVSFFMRNSGCPLLLIKTYGGCDVFA